MKKISIILISICLSLAFLAAGIYYFKFRGSDVYTQISLDEFSPSWLKGSWIVKIHQQKENQEINRNFSLKVKSEDAVVISRETGSVDNTDLEGLRDEIYYYYITDIPAEEDFAMIEYEGSVIAGDGLLYLNKKKNHLKSNIKITKLNGVTETYELNMQKK